MRSDEHEFAWYQYFAVKPDTNNYTLFLYKFMGTRPFSGVCVSNAFLVFFEMVSAPMP